MSAWVVAMIRCDSPGCTTHYDGQTDSIIGARHDLRTSAWRLDVPSGDGRRPRDYCPKHRDTGSGDPDV